MPFLQAAWIKFSSVRLFGNYEVIIWFSDTCLLLFGNNFASDRYPFTTLFPPFEIFIQWTINQFSHISDTRNRKFKRFLRIKPSDALWRHQNFNLWLNSSAAGGRDLRLLQSVRKTLYVLIIMAYNLYHFDIFCSKVWKRVGLKIL